MLTKKSSAFEMDDENSSPGTEVDLHTPHWHGNIVTIHVMRTDVANLLPATMTTAEMVPDAVGTWLFHCHVGDPLLPACKPSTR